jgi:hypothetical protein
VTSIPLATETLRCAPWARAEQVDPIGTAGSQSGFLLVEWPLPWPRDIGEIPELAPVLAALRGTGIRIQGLVPASSHTEVRRLVLYRAPADPHGFVRYERTERVVPAPDTIAAALELLESPNTPEWVMAEVDQEVLVCTHGKRDVCCGSLGTALALDLAADPNALGPDVRVWRTSHTGGHRFSPTAIVLPYGTAWAFLDQPLVERIVRRQGDVREAMEHYRGCIGLGSSALQAVERLAFADVGWDWLDYARRGETHTDGTTVLTATAPDGVVSQWSAQVIVRRTVPVPDCGKPIGDAKKSEAELEVQNFRLI